MSTRVDSLAFRTAVAMFVVALVPLGIVGGFAYSRQSDELTRRALDQLTALANIQEARVESFETSARTAVRLVASRTQLRRHIASALDGDPSVTPDINVILTDARDSTPGLAEAYALTADGTVIGSSDDSRIGSVIDIEGVDLDDQDDVLWRVEFGFEQPRLFLAVPAYLEERLLGAIAIERDLVPLAELAQDRDGLGDSGETLLGRRVDERSVIFLTPVRFPELAPSDDVIRSAADLPLGIAVDGREELLTDARDYRGMDVFAVTRHLPGTGWGLVVKIDRAEALAPVSSLGRLLVLTMIVGVAVAALLALLVSRPATRPLRQLADVAHEIEGGDLSARADESAPGEIGALARAFNEMADSVGAHQQELEHLVSQRTVELARTVAELERRNAELDAFSTAVAHDLKSPLAIIKAALELVTDDRVEEAAAERLLDGAVRAADRMHRLIDDLLVLARTGLERVEATDVDLDALITAVAQRDAPSADVRRTDLPTIPGDPRLLEQLFANLLGNSAKYVAPGTAPRIEVTARRVGDAWEVWVDDNGIGIPEQEREGVFAAFTRGDAAQGYDGTGIGLAIVIRVVERHDGSTRIEDSPLGGTRVVVSLPASAG